MITIIIYKRKFVAPTFLPLYLIFKTKLPNSKIPGSQVCDGGDNGGNVWWQKRGETTKLINMRIMRKDKRTILKLHVAVWMVCVYTYRLFPGFYILFFFYC